MGKSNDEYFDNVKKIIQLVNLIEEDKKIDYFASLTRCLALIDLKLELYYKLAKYLTSCTSYELDYVRAFEYGAKGTRDAISSTLFYQGVFNRDTRLHHSVVLSGIGIALKQNCLNYEDGLKGQERIVSYEMLGSLELNSPALFG